jgi:hypothetical protein
MVRGNIAVIGGGSGRVTFLSYRLALGVSFDEHE